MVSFKAPTVPSGGFSPLNSFNKMMSVPHGHNPATMGKNKPLRPTRVKNAKIGIARNSIRRMFNIE